MRTNFNFKAEWAVAIQMLSADIRLRVYEIILSMGIHDISLADALADGGMEIADEDAMNLLISVEKVLARRRRARERAAARRLAKSTAENINEKSNENTEEKNVTASEPVSISCKPTITADAMTSDTKPRHRRHKHKKRKNRNR